MAASPIVDLLDQAEASIQNETSFTPSPLFGLRNLGNSCYFNSGIQLLSSSPEFLSSLAFVLADSDSGTTNENFQKLLSRRGSVDMAHYQIWFEMQQLLSAPLFSHFLGVVHAIRTRRQALESVGTNLTEEVESFAKSMRMAAVTEIKPLAPTALLRHFSQAHPVFEGMMQQDTSEMLNQILSSLDDVCRMDQFPHWLLTSLKETSHTTDPTQNLCASSARALMVIELMHLINLDNARKHCHTSAFKRLAEDVMLREEDGDPSLERLAVMEADEQKDVLATDPPTAPRIYVSAHNNMFRSQTLSTVTCHRCLNQSCSVQEHTGLTVAIPSEAARKRYAAENPQFVYKMRQRWHYDAQRSVWNEKIIRLHEDEITKEKSQKSSQVPRKPQPPRKAMGIPFLRSAPAQAFVAVAVGFLAYSKSAQVNRPFSDNNSLQSDVKALGLGLAASVTALTTLRMVVDLLSPKGGDSLEGICLGSHSSTRSVTTASAKRIRHIKSQLNDLKRNTAGLSDKEAHAFMQRCLERIADEERVANNVRLLFGEARVAEASESSLNLHAHDDHNDDDGASSSLTFSNFDLQRPKQIDLSRFIPHPSATKADLDACPYMTTLKRLAYDLAIEDKNTYSKRQTSAATSFLKRGSHEEQTCFAAGEIDYPLTLEECLGIYSSPNHLTEDTKEADGVNDTRSLLAKKRTKPSYTPDGFRCENCCYGGTYWRRAGGGVGDGSSFGSAEDAMGQAQPNAFTEVLSSRVTSDVTVQTKLLTFPHNLLIHLKRVRPPDDIVDAETGGNEYLVKIEDPVLFPYSRPVQEIVVGFSNPADDEVNEVDGALDLTPVMAEVTSSAVKGFAASANAFLKSVGSSQPQPDVASLHSESSPSTPTLANNLMLGAAFPSQQKASTDDQCPRTTLLKGGLPPAMLSRYRLTSIVNHVGDVSGGHYTAFANRIVGLSPQDQGYDRKWFHFNDSSYSVESIEGVVAEASTNGCVFLFQQLPQNTKGSDRGDAENAVKVAARAALMSNFSTVPRVKRDPKAKVILLPRWWLIQAAVVNEPGPIWVRKQYVSDPSADSNVRARGKCPELLSFAFRSRASQSAEFPNEWFYVPVPVDDARLMMSTYGGDALC